MAGLASITARHLNPALVLMDINLPGMDGVTARKKLLGDEATRHIPVVAVSADAMPYHRERALQAGFQDYLTKPIRIQEFRDVVHRYVNKSNVA